MDGRTNFEPDGRSRFRAVSRRTRERGTRNRTLGPMPEYEYVLSTADGPVGIVTLNRPRQLNALARPLLQELVDALEQHDADPAIRAIVLTGGPTVFAAGADIKEMADASAVDMLLRNNIALWD